MKSGDTVQPPVHDSSLREVLQSSVLRQRIIEYLGGATLEEATCSFLGRVNAQDPSHFERHPASHLDRLIRQSCELARSLEDRDASLIHLDIEYVNFDDPLAAFRDPQRAFLLQEPLVRVIESQLLALGIRYLHLVTGQGHHFVWKIPKHSPVARAIGKLGIVTTPDLECPPQPMFPHLALLMEFLAQRLKRDGAAVCEVPVEITAQHVGSGCAGAREMLSIDTSEYGDPLSSRMIRIPYTIYRKPWISGLIDRLGMAGHIPEFCALPLYEMDIFGLIAKRHDPDFIVDLAQRASVTIPLEEKGTRRLLDDYRKSGLIEFHGHFYSRAPSQPPDQPPLDRLPPCARHLLEHPNDLLLKPSGIQLVTRCLLAEGWHPRRIAGCIIDIFRDPRHDWGSQWIEYDPVLRAEFYVRLFAGQIDQGIDQGVDFNCVSQQEKQFCWNPQDCSLEPFFAKIHPQQQPEPPST